MSLPQAFQPASVLTSPQAAAYLGVKPQTLRKWRVSGRGPRYVRLGSSPRARVAYRVYDLAAWLDQRSYASTAAETIALTGLAHLATAGAGRVPARGDWQCRDRREVGLL